MLWAECRGLRVWVLGVGPNRFNRRSTTNFAGLSQAFCYALRANFTIGVYNRLMFWPELIDLRIRESPTDAPHFSFRLESPYSEPLLNPI